MPNATPVLWHAAVVHTDGAEAKVKKRVACFYFCATSHSSALPLSFYISHSSLCYYTVISGDDLSLTDCTHTTQGV